MSSLSLLLLGLLALLGGASPSAAKMTTSIWYRAQVSQDQLAAANTSKIYQALDDILCAILASDTPWCHLFTHEGISCVLYDVVVDSLAEPPSQGSITSCKTRHRNVCIVDGKPLAHGDTLVNGCTPSICSNRALVPINTESSTSNVTFLLTTIGCVHLYKQDKTWYEGREYCTSLKADLAVVSAESFSKLQDFLLENAEGKEKVWVGVKGAKWLDGRVPPREEWSWMDPNAGPDACSHMWLYFGNYILADIPCNSEKFWVLCMKT